MVLKKKRQCVWKDRSPLGLLGILLITAGVIIAIYDVKDALPNQSESYVLVIGVLLSLMGVVSVVLAFLGFRRSRALARENKGTTFPGKNKKKWTQRRQFRRVSISSNPRSVNPTADVELPPGESSVTHGPSLVSLPQTYSMALPNQERGKPLGHEGTDNLAYEKSPTHVQTYAIPDSLFSYQGNTQADPTRGEEIGNHNHIMQRSMADVTSNREQTYTPPLPSWSSIEVAEYITPVSTTV